MKKRFFLGFVINFPLFLAACSDHQDYAWDAFYDKNKNIQWRCRDIETAKFVESRLCSDQLKQDNTWPKK